jgi:hypothetical protein
VTNNSPRKFFRATPYVISKPEAEVCVNNLRQIRIAKLLWQRDNDVNVTYFTPQASDLVPYFPHQIAPFCPLDYQQLFPTSYLIADLEYEPVCHINPNNSHVLEDPR